MKTEDEELVDIDQFLIGLSLTIKKIRYSPHLDLCKASLTVVSKLNGAGQLRLRTANIVENL